jgi:hypothetical protein
VVSEDFYLMMDRLPRRRNTRWLRNTHYTTKLRIPLQNICSTGCHRERTIVGLRQFNIQRQTLSYRNFVSNQRKRPFSHKRKKALETQGFQDFESGTPGEIRTPGLLIRSQALYPAELRVL